VTRLGIAAPTESIAALTALLDLPSLSGARSIAGVYLEATGGEGRSVLLLQEAFSSGPIHARPWRRRASSRVPTGPMTTSRLTSFVSSNKVQYTSTCNLTPRANWRDTQIGPLLLQSAAFMDRALE
jgi:hypothetical protein